MRAISARIERLEHQLGVSNGKPQIVLVIHRAGWESDQYQDLCFQILRENGFLPKSRLCFVNLREVPGGLPPDELRRFLKEHGAETIGIRPRRD
jgi:hypothetical protein